MLISELLYFLHEAIIKNDKSGIKKYLRILNKNGLDNITAYTLIKEIFK